MGEKIEKPAAAPKKVIVRKRAGFRRIMVTVTEEQAKRLDELAIQDDRGSATNIAKYTGQAQLRGHRGDVQADTAEFDVREDE